MAWESTFLPKQDRPLLDIPTSSPDLHTLRTPIDPHPHPPPWYTQGFPALHAGYQHFQRDIDFDDVPPSPPRRMLELLQADLPLELSPPSPSRRAFRDLPGTHCIYPPPSYDPYADCPSPPSLSPPSPSRRSLALLPSPDELAQWSPHQAAPELEDCPELSPPSPRHSPLGLPMEDDVPPEEPAQELMQEPTCLPLLPVDSSFLHEHVALLSLRDRTLLAERTSRARNVALRTHERALAKLVADMREEAPAAPCDMANGDRANALRSCRATATQVMLERIELKRKRKKDKERLRELRVILGVGVEGWLGESSRAAAAGSGVAAEEEEGLGLVLDQAQAQEQFDHHHHYVHIRREAMSRLVARMAIRRREMGMRGLLEAGSLAQVGGGEREFGAGRAAKGPSPLKQSHEDGYQEEELEDPTVT